MGTGAILIRTPEMDWTPASFIYGESVMYNNKDMVFVKQLTNRLDKGKGVAYLIKLIPPKGKIIRIIAVARSDEHVYILEGGYCYRNGAQRLFPGDYELNPEGHPHANLVNIETVALVICTGATDEVKEISCIEPKT